MKVRLGIVGAGFIARQHLAQLVTDPSVEIAALCDTDVEAARAAQAELLADPPGDADREAFASLAAARLHGSAREMFEAEQLDAAFVCLPPDAHGDAEMAALAAGVSMLVEKPVTLDIGIARRVERGLRDQGLIGASGYLSRYSEVVEHVRASLEGRTIGMTIANRFTRLPGKEWYREQAKSGGQVVEMVTHQLDLLRCVVGEIATVYAAAGRRIATSAESDVFDVAAATLTFANGAVGTLSTNLVSAHGTPAHARGIHIFAEGRTVSILGHEGERRTVHTVDAGGRTEQTFEDVSMRAQDRAFVAAVRERRPELVKSSYESGMRTLAVTLAHQRSAELGQPVGVDGLLGGG